MRCTRLLKSGLLVFSFIMLHTINVTNKEMEKVLATTMIGDEDVSSVFEIVKMAGSLMFVAQNPQLASVTMRGRQFIDQWKIPNPSDADNKRSHSNSPADWKYGVEQCGINTCTDVCVFLGPCKDHKWPKKSCCKVKILDVIDKYLYEKKHIDASLNHYDALVVNSNYMKDYFQRERNFMGDILVLPHHSDPRWRDTKTTMTKSSDTLRFGYTGSIPSLAHTDNFLHADDIKERYPITFVDTDEGILPDTLDFGIDMSIREPDTDVSRFKTTAKVATAAALGHNIITTWDEAVKDYLPEDYPFALKDSSLETIQKTMDMAMADYAGDQVLWKKGLEMMKEVDKKLNINVIASKYHEFLSSMLFTFG